MPQRWTTYWEAWQRGSGGEDRLTENVTLNFDELGLQLIPQK